MSVASVGMVSAAAAPDAAQHRRLVDAAQQFEGMFLEEMLKPMSTMGKGDGDAEEDSGEDGGDMSTYQSYGTEAMARAIAAAGGLGIARHVVEEVERTAKHTSVGEIPETSLKSAQVGTIELNRRAQ